MEHRVASNEKKIEEDSEIDNEMKRELVNLIDWPIANLPKLRFKNGYSIKTLAFRRKYYTFADEQEPKI